MSTGHALSRMASTPAAVNRRPLPKFNGFPAKLKKIAPELEQTEREINAILEAVQARLNEIANNSTT